MGIKNWVQKASDKAANKVAKLSALSSEQLDEIEALRQKYFLQSPNPNDELIVETTNRYLAASGVEIYNAYLPQIQDFYTPIKKSVEDEGMFDESKNIRFINITKWVIDKNENSLEKLVNVYETLSNEDCNIALIFERTCFKTNVYLGITNTNFDDNNVDVGNYKKRLVAALRGNFPGSEIAEISNTSVESCLKNDNYSVASVSNIPTEKSEKFISQTIEKLLDGIVPQNPEEQYVLVLLATPVKDIDSRKMRLAEYYSNLSSFSSWQTNYTVVQSQADTSTATFGVNAGVSAGLQQGTNQSINKSTANTENEGSSLSETTQHLEQNSESKSTSNSTSKQQGKSNSYSTSSSVGGNAGVNIGFINAGVNGSSSTSQGFTSSITEGVSNTLSNSVSNSISESVGKAVTNTVGKALTNTLGKTLGSSRGVNFGGNFGANFARSSNVTASIGKNEGITQTFTNYNIKHSLDLLEEQMKRYDICKAIGMWDFAAYVLSEDSNIASNVAHSYLALTEGEKSFMSQAAINVWRGDVEGIKPATNEIVNYISELRHPLFTLNPAILANRADLLVYPPVVNTTATLSGKELAYALNFPRKSITGLPVLECAEFGRNISSYNFRNDNSNQIKLGNIFHMNQVEKTRVYLNEKSLASHTFITGSTGSGKSNTVYQILDEAIKDDKNFMVIEPTKGEYKNIFGSREDVRVFGTNPNISELLRINPFSFEKGIHILEHLDRLVELFNVCWPMYAAMPAVLKNAIEKSYQDCGWDLIKSTNEFNDNFYPCFADVARNIKTIIDSSEYDSENKGAYKGSLLTRLQSLSNGINGLIFSEKEVEPVVLFNEKVIVDLSRVGSTETKSLIMGMLVLKLQEFRMSTANEMNSDLKHITVLEEAHNLLKRTSTEQSVESSNLVGKSVEMLANSIAEMRTYGEGFIIVDQAPGLLDMSAIRNTNTKIIMRLPDKSDRELVGYAANLNEDQINELAKLPCGVGAIYQNDWIQPVLCKINRFLYEEKAMEYYPVNDDNDASFEKRLMIAELLSKGTRLEKEVVLNDIVELLEELKMSSTQKVSVIRNLLNPPVEPRMTKLAPIMNELFPEVTKAIKDMHSNSSIPSEWTNAAENALRSNGMIDLNNQVSRDIVQSVMTYYLLIELDNIDALQEWSVRGGLI